MRTTRFKSERGAGADFRSFGILSAALGALAILGGVIYWFGFRLSPENLERKRLDANMEIEEVFVDLELVDVEFEEALEALISQANEDLAWGRKWKYRVDVDNPASRSILGSKVTIQRGRLALNMAISQLVSQAKCKYSVEPGREIVIHTHHPVFDFQPVRGVFRVTEAEALALWASTESEEIQADFLEKGVFFPHGAGVFYEPSISLLVVTNTSDQLELVRALLPHWVQSVPMPDDWLIQKARFLFAPSN